MSDSNREQAGVSPPASPHPSLSASPPEESEGKPDPEIEALLDFEPVPRAYKQKGAWTPALQRMFIARLAMLGSVNKAAEELGKDPGGVRRLRKGTASESFRASWDAALDLWERRNPPPPPEPPGAGDRRKPRYAPPPFPSAGEGNAESLRREAEESRDLISMKLLNARRLYLREISNCPGKRAAFEILTDYAIDWDKARNLERQADEPWRKPNMRHPDMILTAENGWMGDFVHGPDKKAELRRTFDEWRAEMGLEAIKWEGEEEETKE